MLCSKIPKRRGLLDANWPVVNVFDTATSSPAMIVSSPSAPVTLTLEAPLRARSSVSPLSDPTARQRLLLQAATLNEQARVAATQGDLEASARAILEALDCERRAGGLGLQVLQLIKPRA
jgi:hypothetical protein